ncbi:cystathionine beta-lyase [Peribacillus deserti]|uniref:cysteine-S-conjugate beta-lyase n=1 Tax=Peribacillus deserti TaxID=673318 RepID=A0ABS2QFV0_9BACI|nr:MalY/PatB family protein [Peribacillus deserti]MBM7692041.1 cystathionine beta-lyase [Peribacillus deserti]
MKYDFDKHIIRTNTGSVKWDHSETLFGDKDILPMWVADMDFKAPQPVIDALIEKAEHGIFGYTKGLGSYHDAIIGWMKERHKWEVKSEWICHSPGVVPALNLIVQTFTDPGDKIIIQHPVYYPFTKVIEMNGRTVVSNPLKVENGQYVMDYLDLEEKIDEEVKMMILCSPHNPVGRVWTREELIRVGEICLKHNILMVSDEVHADLVLKGDHTVFAAISDEFAQRSIICTAPSKTFNLAGLQTSNIIIPNPEIREKFSNALEANFMGGMNTFGVAATESAYRYGEEWLDQLLVYVQANFDYLAGYIETHLQDLVVYPLEGTYLAWIDCRELGLDHQALEELIHKEAKVALNQGYIFGEGGEGFIRLNLACTRSTLEEGLQRIERAIGRIRG